MQVVVSSAFESSVGIAVLAQVAASLDRGLTLAASTPASSNNCSNGNGAKSHQQPGTATCHGLGTLPWFRQDTSSPQLSFSPLTKGNGSSGVACTSNEAWSLLQHAASPAGQQQLRNKTLGSPNPSASSDTHAAGQTATSFHQVETAAWGEYTFRVIEINPASPWAEPSGNDNMSTLTPSLSPSSAASFNNNMLTLTTPSAPSQAPSSTLSARSLPSLSPPPFLFLHGLLGSSEDWLPIMQGLAAAGHRCTHVETERTSAGMTVEATEGSEKVGGCLSCMHVKIRMSDKAGRHARHAARGRRCCRAEKKIEGFAGRFENGTNKFQA